MPGPRTRVPQHHHKGSSPTADEAYLTHQTLPQCVTVAKAKRAMKVNRVQGEHPPPNDSEETTSVDHRGQRFHSSVRDTADYFTLTRVGWILPSHQTVQTVGSIHKMSHTCLAHPNNLAPVNLWNRPTELAQELSFLDPGRLD